MQSNKLYVGNLNYSTTTEQLQELFKTHGEVKNVNIIEGKGFGFVEMSNDSEAGNAKTALNGFNFLGRNIKVNDARPPKERQNRNNF